MMKSFLAVLLLSMAFLSSAFAPAPTMTRMSPTTALRIMTQDETAELMSQAGSCAEGECSLDDVGDLISLLQTQQQQLGERLDEIRSMIASLEDVNAKDERQVDEVRETVRALYRVFQLGSKASNNDYPSLSKPTGYSGDVGDGPTDAYRSLKPKPWKATP